jgi:hypothetical protein
MSSAFTSAPVRSWNRLSSDLPLSQLSIGKGGGVAPRKASVVFWEDATADFGSNCRRSASADTRRISPHFGQLTRRPPRSPATRTIAWQAGHGSRRCGSSGNGCAATAVQSPHAPPNPRNRPSRLPGRRSSRRSVEDFPAAQAKWPRLNCRAHFG